MSRLTKASALAVCVTAVLGGAVLAAPAATAATAPAAAVTVTSDDPPECNASTNGMYWFDPWSERLWRCMRDGSAWVWVEVV